jgi:cytochrome c-type biogenesis protein CcsB
MKNRIVAFCFSMPMEIALLAIFAVAIGRATFIERDLGAAAARSAVYGAWWFEALFALIALNLTGTLVRAGLWRRRQYRTLGFHAAFLVILSGAAITRHFGRSGSLHFRDGETASTMLSDEAFLSVRASDGTDSAAVHWPITSGNRSSTGFSKKIRVGTADVLLRIVDVIPSADSSVVETEDGVPFAILAVSDGKTASELVLAEGDLRTLHGVRFAFGATAVPADARWVRFDRVPQGLTLTSGAAIRKISMTGKGNALIRPGVPAPAAGGSLYAMDGVHFALKRFVPSGRIRAVPSESDDTASGESSVSGALELEVTAGGVSRGISCFENEGRVGDETRIRIGGTEATCSYGSLATALPFRLRLDDFKVDRYPGSKRPSGFQSSVTVIDPGLETETSRVISMNRILKHKGFRLYQASFDPDEQGSVLSVSRDPGMAVTYAGYWLLGALLVGSFLSPKSRFRRLGEKLKETGKAAVWIGLGLALLGGAGNGAAVERIEPDGSRFSSLPVQDQNGRIKPLLTLTMEAARTSGHPEIPMRMSLGRMAWELAFDADSANWGAGFRKAASIFRPGFRPFPIPGDPQLRWGDESTAVRGPDSVRVREIMNGIRAAAVRADWDSADRLIDTIRSYQKEAGGGMIPSSGRIRAEMLYDRLDLFRRLGTVTVFLGLALLACRIASNLKRLRPSVQPAGKTAAAALAAVFLLLTLGLALRWIASGHAPWTNKYESMVYTAWIVLAAGFLSIRFSLLPLALSGIGSGFLLKAAHTAATNTEIGTLAPVLKSKWLIVHVSVIVASYGFFLVGALIAVSVLILLAAGGSKKTLASREAAVARLSRLEERQLLAGLLLIMLGNLFGAVWANESWGRYWGWDPKETWTLIVILAYTAALHVRLIRPLDRPYWLSVFSAVGIACVVMTYWGVNALLTGMHSYGGGGSASVPAGLLVAAGTLVALMIAAFRNRNVGMEKSASD